MLIGDLVELRATLIHTGNSSMHISVDVFSKSPQANDWVRNTHCIIIFVSIDKDGKPTAVPVFAPETDEEKEMQQYAIRLMELRKGIEDEMEEYCK
jgi:acyl-CoA hydrolase